MAVFSILVSTHVVGQRCVSVLVLLVSRGTRYQLDNSVLSLCRIWLYGYVSADQGGEVLLPHFINHYHQLGITYRRMLILVHHDPERSRESLERIATICHGYMLECRFWEEPFSIEGQYREHLKMLKDFVYDPYDWILYANVNEFHDWEGNIKCVLFVILCRVECVSRMLVCTHVVY